MKVEPKIHNGGSTNALRLTRAEMYKNGSSKKNCISHTSIAMNDLGIDNNSSPRYYLDL